MVMLAGAALLVAALSALADHRRSRRRNLDRPGWVPWTALQIAAALIAVLAVALGLRG
jgi:hypothetical protein